LTMAAATTIVTNDMNTGGCSQQDVVITSIVSFNPNDETDTVYLPAGTFGVRDGAEFTPPYGTFTVADIGGGVLAVTGTAGAAVATGNTIDFDLTKLAAVTISGTDLTTATGVQQPVIVNSVVSLRINHA